MENLQKWIEQHKTSNGKIQDLKVIDFFHDSLKNKNLENFILVANSMDYKPKNHKNIDNLLLDKFFKYFLTSKKVEKLKVIKSTRGRKGQKISHNGSDFLKKFIDRNLNFLIDNTLNFNDDTIHFLSEASIQYKTCLTLAIKNKKEDLIIEKLINNNIDGLYSIHHAIKNEYSDNIVQLLINKENPHIFRLNATRENVLKTSINKKYNDKIVQQLIHLTKNSKTLSILYFIPNWG